MLLLIAICIIVLFIVRDKIPFKLIFAIIMLILYFATGSKMIHGGKHAHNKKHIKKYVTKYGVINGTMQLDKFIPLNEVKFYDEYSRAIIVDGMEPTLNHTRGSTQKIVQTITEDPKRILDIDSQPELVYNDEYISFKPTCHWGQLKLFLSEIEFLTRACQEAMGRSIVFVYAGAAPGEHTKFLHDMFPQIKFVLIDPNPFSRDLVGLPNVKILNNFFTPETADYFRKVCEAGYYVAFCCDVRTYPASEATVVSDMNMQFGWWRKMNPNLAMFKFRLPWGVDPNVRKGMSYYPEGDIYIQCYSGTTSTETRLIVKQDAKDIIYDDLKYEDHMFTHNTIHRTNKYILELGELKLTDGPLYLDNCYDCASFVSIVRNYMLLNKSYDINRLKRLIIDIQAKSTTYKGSPKNVLEKTIMEYSKQVTYKHLAMLIDQDRVEKPIKNMAHEGNQQSEQARINGTYPDIFDDFILEKK